MREPTKTTAATESKAANADTKSPDAANPAPTADAAEIDGLAFDCERLSIYHAARRDWFERAHRWTMFLVAVSGTSAFAASGVAPYLALVPAGLGLVDLVFGVSWRAREHASLYQRFCWLRGQILAGDGDAEALSRAQRDIHGIYADEPPVYRALDAWSHNLACSGRGVATNHYLAIPKWHRAFMNLWPFHGAAYERAG